MVCRRVGTTALGAPFTLKRRCVPSRTYGREANLDTLLDLAQSVYAWAATLPTLLQIALGIGLLATGYFLYVVIATTLAALYAAFFK